jgi:cation diffusion facilitator CzcD-associated flavoprotein CzcO
MQNRNLSSPESVLKDLVIEPVVIIGAGPAGLAVAACLHRAGIGSLILEQGEQVGSAWRQHYDRLHLHTIRLFSSLPYYPFPKGYPRYLSRLQVIEYLESYARHFQSEPKFGQKVIRARLSNNRWEVQTQDCTYYAANVVVASGYNHVPYLPAWPGQTSFAGTILHSSEYRNGEPFRGQKVLVVGFGNSGGEIAIDLWESGADTSLAVRGPVNVVLRDPLGIPVQVFIILQRRLPPRVADAMNAPILAATIGDLKKYSLQKSSKGPLTEFHERGRVPLIDVGTLKLIEQGKIHIRPGIERFTEDQVVFTDGSAETFDAVLLATGFRPHVDAFLDDASTFDEDGTPLTSGRQAGVVGLYFCGFYVSPTGMLWEINAEARRISAEIVRNTAKG